MASVGGFGDLFSVVLAASKDKIYMETAEKMIEQKKKDIAHEKNVMKVRR